MARVEVSVRALVKLVKVAIYEQVGWFGLVWLGLSVVAAAAAAELKRSQHDCDNLSETTKRELCVDSYDMARCGGAFDFVLFSTLSALSGESG